MGHHNIPLRVRVDVVGMSVWVCYLDGEEGRMRLRNHMYDRRILAVDLPRVFDSVAVVAVVVGLYRNSLQRASYVVVVCFGTPVKVELRRMQDELLSFHCFVGVARRIFLVLVPVPVPVLVFLFVVVVVAANDRMTAGRNLGMRRRYIAAAR